MNNTNPTNDSDRDTGRRPTRLVSAEHAAVRVLTEEELNGVSAGTLHPIFMDPPDLT
ncbi:MAG: hypothetical protein JO227_12405 [Acetobacteraceae bacterium]|nr:hypothetical protein [Acetobacteraceae bacterium]